MGRSKSRRTLLIAVALVIVVLVAGDRPGARAAVAVIDQYRAHVSPKIARFTRCRFKPSCSAYGREAILKYGLWRGGAKTAARIARCGPWTPAGTVDRP